ncbi:GNAT family N-acyltransferase [Ectothiorhodospira sp. 9905]|uniref:GNAT family N-acyltransferase n=1 Tax=unclassified Ectothiorhodospira TaxID=2684909 RepID=UPI00351D579A
MSDANYQAIVADTPLARRIHHEIRYAVYCLDRGFEDPGSFPDGQERDMWDEYSVPFIFRHNLSGCYLGALRLVPPVKGKLPVSTQTTLGGSGYVESSCFPVVESGEAWELSRICITEQYQPYGSSAGLTSDIGVSLSQQGYCPERDVSLSSEKATAWRSGVSRGPIFRSSQADDGSCLSSRDGIERLTKGRSLTSSPNPLQGAFSSSDRAQLFAEMSRAAIEYTRNQGVPYLYFLANRALARRINRLGLKFHLAGAPCEHRGTRFPYLGHLDEGVSCAVQRSEEMARLFCDGNRPYQFASELRLGSTSMPKVAG